MTLDLAAVLRPRARPRRYPRGSLVVAEGDEAHEVLVVVVGAVKVTVAALDGRQVVLDVLGPGELVGELGVLDGAPRSATAVALVDTEVLALGREAFRAAMAADPALAGGVLEMTVARLRGAARRQLELGATDALGRVCERLVEVARRYGRRDDQGGIVVRSPLTQQDLAEWAGLSREAVVKALRALRSLGWVDVRGRDLVLLDLEAVAGRAPVARA